MRIRLTFISNRTFFRSALVSISTIVIILLGFLLASEVGGQTRNKSVESAYKAIQYFRDHGDWENALKKVDSFRKKFPNSTRESSVSLVAAQSSLNLRDLARAYRESKRLLLKFPESAYVDDAHWILGKCAVMTEAWDEARKHFKWILASSSDAELKEGCRLALNEIRTYLKSSDSEKPSTRKIPQLGLVLPLSGHLESEAAAFLRGFDIAWRMYGVGTPIVYDSESDPIRAIRLAQLLAREDGVWGIVGGIGCAEAAALAAEAEALKVPFLSTCSGVAELAAIGQYVFQGRADYRLIGRELGQHAMIDLQLSRFGMLTPLDQAGRQIAEGFKESIQLSGGEILAEEVYYPGTDDFAVQFERIRVLGLRRVYDDSLRAYWNKTGHLIIDSLKFTPKEHHLVPEPLPEGIELTIDEEPAYTLSSDLLDSLWKTDHKRLREWMVKSKQDIDSLEIPLSIYDGFLMVIEQDAIPVVAPQFARFNLQTQLLGDENWADDTELAKVERYVDGLIYADPVPYIGGDQYYRFAGKVSELEGEEVNRYHLSGERAARMMAFALKRADGPAKMRIAMTQIRNLPTLSGKVSLLKGERVDRNVALVKFADGESQPVKR